MIAAANRFHGTNSLNYVYRQGKTLRSKYFSVKFITNSRRDRYRLAVVISRKVAKNAADRNRVRRRLYELFRTEVAPNLGNVDVVINVFDAQIAELPAEQLRSAFLYAFRDLQV